MKNESNGEAEITWVLKDEDSTYNSPFFISNSNITEFKLKNNKPHNLISMSFGTGSWTPDYLHSITQGLESLTIKSTSKTQEYKTSDEIYSYLVKLRKGFTKSKILIAIED